MGCRTNPHWREDRDSNWGKFFDLEALRKVVPVMELDEFIKQRGTGAIVDDVLHMQSPARQPDQPFKWSPGATPAECNFGTYPGSYFPMI